MDHAPSVTLMDADLASFRPQHVFHSKVKSGAGQAAVRQAAPVHTEHAKTACIQADCTEVEVKAQAHGDHTCTPQGLVRGGLVTLLSGAHLHSSAASLHPAHHTTTHQLRQSAHADAP